MNPNKVCIKASILRVFYLSFLLLLSGCGGGGSDSNESVQRSFLDVEFSVALYDDDLSLYSFEGGVANVYGLQQVGAQPGLKRSKTIGTGQIDANQKVALRVVESDLNARQLYVIEFACPPGKADSLCQVEAPVRLVLTASQLRKGGIAATVLSEIVYQKLAYYLAAEYTVDQLKAYMDYLANSLFVSANGGVELLYKYEDILAWNPARSESSPNLRRPNLIAGIVAILARHAQDDVEDLQREVGRLLDPVIATIEGAGVASSVVVVNRLAYVIDVGSVDSRIRAIDVTDREVPEVIGSLTIPGKAVSLAVFGGYAFVADSASLVHVIDVRRPDAPAVFSTFDLPGRALSIAASDSYLYVAGGAAGVHVVNVSDPMFPLIAGVIDTPGNANSVAISGHYAYVADDSSGLQVVDISDPWAPTLVGSVATPGRIVGLAISGAYAYAIGDSDSFYLIDIANPLDPIVVNSILIESQPLSIHASGNYIYIGMRSGNLAIANVRDVPNVRVTRQIRAAATAIAVFALDGFAYLAESFRGFSIVDALAPEIDAVLVGKMDTERSVLSVDVIGERAYLATGVSGLVIADTEHAEKTTAVGTLPDLGFAYALAAKWPYVYVASVEDGLRLIDVTLEGNPMLVGTVSNMGWVDSIDIAGNYAYVTSNYAGLYAIDVAQPSFPSIAGNVRTPWQANSVSVSGDFAYVAVLAGNAYSAGLQVVDIQSPSLLTLKGRVDLPGTPWQAKLRDRYAYVACGASGLAVVDISNPDQPNLLSVLELPGGARSLTINGDYAYVVPAIRTTAIHILDVHNSSHPVLLGSAATSGDSSSISTNERYVYVGTSRGLDILKLVK